MSVNYYTLNFRDFIDISEKVWLLQDALGIERTLFSISGFDGNASVYIREDSDGEKTFERTLHRFSIAYVVEPYELSSKRIMFLLTARGYPQRDYELYTFGSSIKLLLKDHLDAQEYRLKLQAYQCALEKDFSVIMEYPALVLTAV